MNKTKHFGKRALIILLPMFFVILGAIIFIGTHKESNEKKEDIIDSNNKKLGNSKETETYGDIQVIEY